MVLFCLFCRRNKLQLYIFWDVSVFREWKLVEWNLILQVVGAVSTWYNIEQNWAFLIFSLSSFGVMLLLMVCFVLFVSYSQNMYDALLSQGSCWWCRATLQQGRGVLHFRVLSRKTNVPTLHGHEFWERVYQYTCPHLRWGKYIFLYLVLFNYILVYEMFLFDF